MSFYGPREVVAVSDEGGAYVAPARRIHDQYNCGLIRRLPVEYLSPVQLSPYGPDFAVGCVLL